MILNQDDARAKWCPLTLQDKPARCLASDCMAWRWAEYTPHVCDRCGTEETVWRDQPDQRRGFCGIPGTPKL